MSSYGDPAPEHRNAVSQVSKARQRALNAVSELRQSNIQTPHQNLARVKQNPNDPAEPSDELPIACTQAVVDYLLQLRPYRHTSRNWEVDFGKIVLPESVGSSGSKRRSGGIPGNLNLQGEQQIPLGNTSEIIEAANTTVCYTSVSLGNQFGTSTRVKRRRYKVVFSPGTLLKIVELADEIAVEMDMLAELKPPDHSSGGGDAV